MMRIAVDAMGGDKAPQQIVRGCVDAARGLSSVDEIIMVGNQVAITAELKEYKKSLIYEYVTGKKEVV